MRGLPALRVALPIAVVAAMALPGAAGASNPALWVAKNGYQLFVTGRKDNVSVTVFAPHGLVITSYIAKGTVTPNRLRASFGPFGRISVRFHPSSNRAWEKRHRRCHGAGRFVLRDGVFVGKIDFRGEGGYVAIRSRRAKGSVGDVAAKCKRGRSGRRELHSIWLPPPSDIDELPVLSAGWREGVRSAQFSAIGGRRGISIFVASAEESRGRVAINRLALLFGEGRSLFTADDALTLARVSPPPPFQGRGTYRAGPDGVVSWTGSLRVDFPGAEDYPLTGPPFRATVEPFSSPFIPFSKALQARLRHALAKPHTHTRWTFG